MKCLKCHKDFPNPDELCDHLKNNYGICGKNEIACSQCGLRFGELSNFINHFHTCKRVSLDELQNDAVLDAVSVNESGSSEDVEMFFETTDGFVVTSDCIIESDDAEARTAEDEIGVDLHQPCGINCENMFYGGIHDLAIILGTDKHLLGHMIKFRHLLRQNSTTGDETTTEIQMVEEDQAGVDEMTIESHKLKLKSLLESWDVGPLCENLTACGINIENMSWLEDRDFEIILGNDKHLLGHMIKFKHLLQQWGTDSTSNKPDTSKETTFVDVLNILNHSADGKTFVHNYENHKLDDDLRCKLVSIILKQTFSKGIVSLPRYCQNDMAKQICQIFTKEKKHIYYQKLKNHSPTGILYSKYSNMRHAYLKQEGQLSSNNESEIIQEESSELESRGVDIHEVNLNESDQYLTVIGDVDAEVSLKFIKDYTEDCNKQLLLDHWKNTFLLRQVKFSEYDDIGEVFADWPPLKGDKGHALLCMDFVQKYGVETSNGLNRWNSFFEKNLSIISGIIKDPIIKKRLSRLDSSTSFEMKNKEIVMALHHLLVPSKTKVNREDWKPTVVMSQQSFLKDVNGQQVMLSVMAKRDNFCKRYGMKNHPVIFEITTFMGTRYNVCLKGIYYTVESLIEGIDVAYKMFKILNIDFPLECRKVWKFIEHIFYGEYTNISGKLLSIVSDLNEN